jgi:predicted amidohydrolase YtcJ
MAADLLLHNGKVITLDERFRIAQSIAITGDRITAVGSDAELAPLRGPQTRLLALHGKAVMPGLIDGHAHMDREGLKTVFPSLAGARSIDDILQKISELARERAPGEWIVTMPIGDPPYYWDVPDNLQEKRLPNRWDLDKAAPDNPVYIRPIWGFWRHTMPLVSVANSRALELAGITRHSVAPLGMVQIDKDYASGEPTGIFLEWTMQPVVELSLLRAATGFTHADRVRSLPIAMRAYHAAGTTSIYEEHGVAGELLRAYREVREQGKLTMRCNLVFSPDWKQLGGAAVDTFLATWGAFLGGRGLGDDQLRVGGLIVNLGQEEDNLLRGKASPYTGWSGFHYDTGLDRATAKAVLIAAARNDIRIVSIWPDMIDLFEEVNEIVPIADKRWVLGHISSLTPDQIRRIRDLGLIVSTHTNRYIFKEGHLLRARLGVARENEISPLRALQDAGVRFALATDNVPCSLFYPIWQAVTRSNRYVEGPIAPQQRISREEALRAATINGAYLTQEEKHKGTIEPGKLADLAVLSADPLTVPENDIKDIVADLTIIGGRIVYDRREKV